MTGGAGAYALVLHSPRQLSGRDFPLPSVGADDAVLRVEACGLCGTDHEQYTGRMKVGFAFVPGHETVGTIEEIGPVASERWGVTAGDRVAVEVFQSCRTCDACRSGLYRRCRRHGVRTMYGCVSVDREPALWGGYATHQYLGPDTQLLKLPPGLDPVLATLFNPLGAGVRWGVTVPGTGPGDVVAVLGPGVRGLAALLAAKGAGAGFVMVTGAGERDAGRLDVARRLGADLALDVTVEDPAATLKAATGGLADVVVDVTANAPTALAQGVRCCRPGGQIVLAGMRGDTDETPGFFPDHVVAKEIRIQGALGVDTDAYKAAIELIVDRAADLAGLPRAVVTLDEVEALIQTMAGEGAEPPPVHGVVVPSR